MKESDNLTVGQKIDAIIKWQTDEKVHPMTCRCKAEHNNEKKFEIVGIRLDNKHIFIECTKCGTVQDWIPESVYNYYIQTTPT